MATYTAFIRWNMLEPDWRETIESLLDLTTLHVATFLDEQHLWRREILFEVMGTEANVKWFSQKIEAEDRKQKNILYRHYNEGR